MNNGPQENCVLLVVSELVSVYMLEDGYASV